LARPAESDRRAPRRGPRDRRSTPAGAWPRSRRRNAGGRSEACAERRRRRALAEVPQRRPDLRPWPQRSRTAVDRLASLVVVDARRALDPRGEAAAAEAAQLRL